ncbi:MAG: hypothetical protein U1F57_03750 [bacterium]
MFDILFGFVRSPIMMYFTLEMPPSASKTAARMTSSSVKVLLASQTLASRLGGDGDGAFRLPLKK